MRVGLLDYDLIERPQFKIVNVELMKIGNYYESYGHEVRAVTPLDNIFAFDKLIIGSNRIGNLTKMKNVDKHPNREYVGPAFNNWNYVPTNIKEIDYGEVNIKYYNDLYKYVVNRSGVPGIEKIFNKKWIRLFPNEQSIELRTILTGEKFNIVDTYFFDRPNWEEVIRNLSIYNRYYTFIYPLIIRNTEDLDNFIKILNYNFIGTKGVVLIQNYLELKDFCLKNKNKLNTYSNAICYAIGYDKNNIYGEQFYLDDVINTLQKIRILNELGIEVKNFGARIDYSGFVFTSLMFECLKYYMETKTNNNQTFHQTFLFKNRARPDIIKSYYHFMNTKQQYYYLFSRKFKKEGAELC